jgi:hypothetical protein
VYPSKHKELEEELEEEELKEEELKEEELEEKEVKEKVVKKKVEYVTQLWYIVRKIQPHKILNCGCFMNSALVTDW